MKIKNRIRIIKSVLRYGDYNQVKICQLQYNKCLEGKNILITGGSSGIGFQIAKKCCECGAKIVITGRNETKLEEAIRKLGAQAEYIVWDISDIERTPKHVLSVLDIFEGKLDCLINNAGVQPHEFFPNVSNNEWETIYNINSKGMFFLTQQISKYWMEKKEICYRKIINIDSQGGFVGATYPYRMVKWDIRGLTKGLGLKLAEYGILVNAIAPGIVKTEMQSKVMKQGNNTYCVQNPLKRVCLPEEVAELAVFMISDACNFMVGQTILMDGGYSIK